MERKKLVWVSSSKKDLQELPVDVKRAMGYALHLAQVGEQSVSAKVLKGFGSADVIEVIDMDADGTYRLMYTVRMADAVFVLHAFQKKSKQGIKTPQRDIDLVKSRLKQAQEMYKEMFKKK